MFLIRCWISSSAQHLRYGCYYGWLFVCLLFTIIVYFELFFILRKEIRVLADATPEEDSADEDDDNVVRDDTNSTTEYRSQLEKHTSEHMNTRKKQKQMFNQMRLYPLALILGQGAGTIRRIIELTGGNPSFGWSVAHAFFSGMFGTITAVIYGTRAWNIYKREFSKIQFFS